MTKNAASILLSLALVLFIVLFVFFAYTFLHEGGHAVAGTLFGQSLTEFDINFWSLSAHVGLAGGELTPAQRAIQSAAGAGLPLLVWLIFISLAPRKGSVILEVLKLLSSMVVINTLLAWIVLPLLVFLGKAPPDDVTHFLVFSHMPPLPLTLIALTLYACGWALFLTKIDGLRNEFLLFRTLDREKLTAGARTSIPVMASLIALGVILVLTLNGLAGKNSADRFSPPQDFSLITQVDLSTRSYVDEPIWQFTLNEPSYVGVFIVVRNINTTYFDLSIAGPDSFRSTILHGEGYAAYEDGGLWEQSLPAGTYQLMLTSHPSVGVASIYLNTH